MSASGLATIDVVIIVLYVLFALVIGSLFFKQASEGVTGFFVGDRKLPWWITGTSIVATTFAADTPLAVAGIVAADGISGNWIWWCWAIAHVSATFFFAKLWRRSGVITDAEITELRYAGRPAAGLRAFKAIYFGIFINCLTMAWVIAAMVKLSIAFFPGVEPSTVITLCILVSVAYTTLGGFRGVVITDVVQFAMGMVGSVIVAWLAVDALGGIGEPGQAAGLIGRLDAVAKETGTQLGDILDFMPRADHPTIPLVYFVVLLVAGWWRYAEGSGYVVQRLAASKNEAHAQAASLWFSVAHNALRPWPWILVGLCGLVVYPKIATEDALTQSVVVQTTAGDVPVTLTFAPLELSQENTITAAGVPFTSCAATLDGTPVDCAVQSGTLTITVPPWPDGGVRQLGVAADAGPPTTIDVPLVLKDRELAYPLLMKRVLPAGLLGLVIASLLAAFMSTIDTHTNWGASYLVTDVYRRFFAPEKSEAHYVWVSRACIVLMAVLAGVTATFIGNIASVWRFIVTLGAGLGSVSAARWYWHRVTPHAEFGALGVTTLTAVGLELFCTEKLFGMDNQLFVVAVPAWVKILIVAGASLAVWIPVALFGPQNPDATVRAFAARVRPPGPGWRGLRPDGPTDDDDALGPKVLRFFVGVAVVFGVLFGTGEMLLGDALTGVVPLGVAVAGFVWLLRSGGTDGVDLDDDRPLHGQGATDSPVAIPAGDDDPGPG